MRCILCAGGGIIISGPVPVPNEHFPRSSIGIIAARTHAESRKGPYRSGEVKGHPKANLIRIKIACVFTTK